MEEWWDWMEGPLVKGVYPQKWYNGVDFNANETGYISHFLQLVGGVQVDSSYSSYSVFLLPR
jgi:hypothetical protein